MMKMPGYLSFDDVRDIYQTAATQRHMHCLDITEITQHINLYQCYNANELNVYSFQMIVQCNTDYKIKIQEALLTKKNTYFN